MTTVVIRTVLAALILAALGFGALTTSTRAAAGQAIAITSVCRSATLSPAPGFDPAYGALQGSFTFKVKNVGTSAISGTFWAAGLRADWDGKGPVYLEQQSVIKQGATRTFIVTLSPLYNISGAFIALFFVEVSSQHYVTTQQDFASFASVPIC